MLARYKPGYAGFPLVDNLGFKLLPVLLFIKNVLSMLLQL